MAWSTSLMFTSWLLDAVSLNLYNIASGGDSLKLALFNNSTTPNVDDTLVNNTYGTGTWGSANEVTGTNWVSGGVALTGQTLTNNTTHGGDLHWTVNNVTANGTTLSSVFGCLIYDTTKSSRGIVAINFGGSFNTVAGTFQINWGSANGAAAVFWVST